MHDSRFWDENRDRAVCIKPSREVHILLVGKWEVGVEPADLLKERPRHGKIAGPEYAATLVNGSMFIVCKRAACKGATFEDIRTSPVITDGSLVCCKPTGCRETVVVCKAEPLPARMPRPVVAIARRASPRPFHPAHPRKPLENHPFRGFTRTIIGDNHFIKTPLKRLCAGCEALQAAPQQIIAMTGGNNDADQELGHELKLSVEFLAAVASLGFDAESNNLVGLLAAASVGFPNDKLKGPAQRCL